MRACSISARVQRKKTSVVERFARSFDQHLLEASFEGFVRVLHITG